MSDADFLGLGRYVQCNDQVPDYCQYDDTVGGTAGHFWIQFEDGEVVYILVTKIDATEFSSVAQAMLKKFGKPKLSQSGTVQNGFGAKFSQHIYGWRGAGWQAVLKERDDSVSESMLSLMADKYAARFEKSRKAAADDM
jgi:hypothetical protein